MRLLGDNGSGYELAQKLEENSTWRAWLGERDHVAIQPYLATPGCWSAFMQSDNPSVLILQLRVRALLFDKAVASLYLETAESATVSALDNSYLQLHPDSVYYSLEQDAEEWGRMQTEKTSAVGSLELKNQKGGGKYCPIVVFNRDSVGFVQYGSSSAQSSVSFTDGEGVYVDISSLQTKSSQAGHKLSNPMISPKRNAKTRYNQTGNRIDLGTVGELWYTQYLQKTLLARKNRLARRISQQQLPFGDQEACLRTPAGMAEYATFEANHRKRRPVLLTDEDFKAASRGSSSVSGTPNLERTSMDSFGLKPNQPGHERFILGGDEDTQFFPEFQFFRNCLPHPVPSQQRPLLDTFKLQKAFLDKLNHLQDLSPGFVTKGKDRFGTSSDAIDCHQKENLSPPTHKSLISEETAQQLAQQAVVKLVAAAEFEGFEEKPLQMLVDLLKCHIRKLGNGLRLIVDTYKNECSQAEILNLYIHGASGSNVGEMMEYCSNKLQVSQKKKLASVLIPQPATQQALAQWQATPQLVSLPLQISYQQSQFQHLQPGFEKIARRRQLASDAMVVGDLGSDAASLTAGLSQMSNQMHSQGHMSWNAQAPNFAGFLQTHQPTVLQQRYKQHL